MKRFLLLLALPLGGCTITVGPPHIHQHYPDPPLDAYIAAWEYARSYGAHVPVVDQEVRDAEERAMRAEFDAERERLLFAAQERERRAQAEAARLRARRARP